MTRVQIITLLILTVVALALLGFAAVYGIGIINEESSIEEIASEPNSDRAEEDRNNDNETDTAEQIPATPTATATPSPIPTNTSTATPTETLIPSPTATLVVHSTATKTSTPTPRPTRTPRPTDTPVPSSNAGGSGSSSVVSQPTGPTPTPTATSRYPFVIVEGPLDYKTKNHFLVVLAKVTKGNVIMPNYRLAGFHSPSKAEWESVPSCDHYCKGSAPVAYMNDSNELINIPRQEGNLVFEFPRYERGTFTLVLLDPQRQQASEPFVLELDSDSDRRKWFYMHFNQ